MVAWLILCLALSEPGQAAQNVEPGRKTFETRCAVCHGADGNGGDIGPPIAPRLALKDDEQLAAFIRAGVPARGMPPNPMADSDMADLLKHLRALQRRAEDAAARRRQQIETTDGRTLDGQLIDEGFDDLQLRTANDRVHLLRRAGARFREVTSDADWPTYNGGPGGNRYTTLTQIDKGNISRLAMAWMFTLKGAGQLQVTPVVADGMMYVAGVNECYALDAGSGRQGREVWRFATVPRRGEPGSETWQGKDIDHGGAPTWFTGSYDPALDTVYWPAGNPSKEYNGEHRKGDNLYSDSILALDRMTGRLKWHYQFTPHDLWDWDATETSVLVDADWEGRPRMLMLHADRNGFFYVFDRRDGTLLLAKPFIRNLTWASGIGSDGRPIKLPNQEPTPEGTKVCPSQDGATNWFSPSFNPATGLYYVQTFEKCSIYTKSDTGEWESGKTYLGGSQRTATDPTPQRILKAIDIRTGAIAWELPQPGPAYSWGGTLATATDLVIVGEDGGGLMAVDAVTGKPLWSVQTNQTWKASPMTYMFDGRQFIAVAAGPNIIAFAVKEPGAAR